MAKKNRAKSTAEGAKIMARNKKAVFNYHIESRVEAGVVLVGSEVKSIRAGNVSLGDSHAQFDEKGELYLVGCHVAEYPWSHQTNHAPRRPRKLLLHKKELSRMSHKVAQSGYSIVALTVYFKNGRVKVELGLGKGKKLFDKRESIKKRDVERDISRGS